MNIVFLTMQILGGGRKVSILSYAEKAAEHGEHAAVITVGNSWISVLKNTIKSKKKHNLPINTWRTVAPNLQGYLWQSVWHPASLKFNVLNRLSQLVYTSYPYTLPAEAMDTLQNADVIVIESGPPVIFINEIKTLNPTAKIVYRASDRLGPIKAHPMLQNILDTKLNDIDLIVVPAEAQLKDFVGHRKVIQIPQGIDKALFEGEAASPFTTEGKNAISVGDMLFDENMITQLATHYPDWNFHLFGNGARLTTKMSNVIEHGEVPFKTLVSYFKHCDIGLVPYRPAPDVDYIAESSIKMTHYTYCQLPIVAPNFAKSSKRPHISGYIPNDTNSIVAAFASAIQYPRDSIDTSQVKSLDETWAILKSEIKAS